MLSDGSRDSVNAAGQGYSLELLQKRRRILSDVRHSAGRGINVLVTGYARGMRECTHAVHRRILVSGAITRNVAEPILSRLQIRLSLDR